jgi:hypothetical protein
MKQLFLMLLLVLVVATAPRAEDAGTFLALSKVHGATMLTNQDLSQVEGSATFHGSLLIPVYFESLSAFMDEVLFTLLHIDGRSPLVTYKQAHPVVIPLPAGGISIRVESHTVIMVKTLVCMVCTKF